MVAVPAMSLSSGFGARGISEGPRQVVPLIASAYATPPGVIRQVKGLLGDRS
jgi:hypothetical protein